MAAVDILRETRKWRLYVESNLSGGSTVVAGTINDQSVRWDAANAQYEPAAFIAFGETDPRLYIGSSVNQMLLTFVGSISTLADIRGHVGFDTSSLEMEWKNLTASSSCTIKATNSSVAEVTFLNANPNGDSLFRGQTGVRLQAVTGLLNFQVPGTLFTMNNAGQLDLLGNGTQSGILKITTGTSEFATTAGTGQLWALTSDERLKWTDPSDVTNTLAYLSEITASLVTAGAVQGQMLYWNTGTSLYEPSSDISWDQTNGRLTITGDLIDLDNSGAASATTIIARNSAGGVTLNVNTTTGNAQIGQASGAGAAEDVWIALTRNAGVSLRHNATAMAATVAAASGGFQVNNTVTGAGFERVLTVSDIGAPAPSTLALAADLSDTAVSTIVVTDDATLTGFTLDADQTYEFEAYIRFSAPGPSGARWNFQIAAGAMEYAVYSWFGISNDGPRLDEDSRGKVSLTTEQTITITNGASVGIRIRGTVRTDVAGATVDFQFAQNVSDVTAITRQRGSWIRFTPINSA